MRDFTFYVDADRIRVRFVMPSRLKKIASGQNPGADYGDKVIRIARGELTRSQQGYLFHELGHYLVERMEYGKTLTQEDACDLMSWAPAILRDPRNGDLRAFLSLEK